MTRPIPISRSAIPAVSPSAPALPWRSPVVLTNWRCSPVRGRVVPPVLTCTARALRWRANGVLTSAAPAGWSCAERGVAYGSSVKQASVAANALADGKMIIEAKYGAAAQFGFEVQPRHTNVTGLICGIGGELTAGLLRYDAAQFGAVFYLTPATSAGKEQALHNRVTLFATLPMARARGRAWTRGRHGGG